MSDIKLNQAEMQALMGKIDVALEETMDALKTDIVQRQIVPKETGNLEGSARAERESKNSFYLEYTTPYAERLYINPQLDFRQDKNKHAQGEWLKPWIDGGRRAWLKKTFAQLLAEQIGGTEEDDG